MIRDKDKIRQRFQDKWWSKLIPSDIEEKIFEKFLTCPIKTIGAMQVSVEKATSLAKSRNQYPGNEEAFRDSLYKKDTNLLY